MSRCFTPSASRTSMGIVTWPLDVTFARGIGCSRPRRCDSLHRVDSLPRSVLTTTHVSSRFLVTEVAAPREDHRDAELVGLDEQLLVADRAARLDERGHASRSND